MSRQDSDMEDSIRQMNDYFREMEKRYKRSQEKEDRAIRSTEKKVRSILDDLFSRLLLGGHERACGIVCHTAQDWLEEHFPKRKSSPSELERRKLKQSIRLRIMERDGYKCLVCGSQKNLQIDHIVPVSKGGKTEPGNLQTLCGTCNDRKGSKT